MEPNVDRGMWSVVALLAAIVIGGVVLLAFPRISGKIANSMDDTVNKAFKGETPSWVKETEEGPEKELEEETEGNNTSSNSFEIVDDALTEKVLKDYKIFLLHNDKGYRYIVAGLNEDASDNIIFPDKLRIDPKLHGYSTSPSMVNAYDVSVKGTSSSIIRSRLSEISGHLPKGKTEVFEASYAGTEKLYLEGTHLKSFTMEVSEVESSILSVPERLVIDEDTKIDKLIIKLSNTANDKAFVTDSDALYKITPLLRNFKHNMTVEFVGIGENVKLKKGKSFVNLMNSKPEINITFNNIEVSEE